MASSGDLDVIDLDVIERGYAVCVRDVEKGGV